jgi:L-threonylcarbamoyladenylate synthase
VPVTVPRWRPGDPVAPIRALLEMGGVLAIPTESSYGLAADPRNAEGIARVYGLKGRDGSKALPLVAAGRGQIAALGLDVGALERPELAPLVARWWPGPLTVVLPLREGADPAGLPVLAPDGTVAVRIPGHRGLRELLAAVGRPLTATSANRSGEPPVLDPDGAAALLAGLPEGTAAVIDGGVLPGGPPSTLVRPRDGRVEVLRPGAFDPFDDEAAGDDRPGARTE